MSDENQAEAEDNRPAAPLGGRRGKGARPARQAVFSPPSASSSAEGITRGGDLEWFRVVKGGPVPRHGGTMLVATDQVVSSASHDITALRSAGIEVEPCDAPDWYIRAQSKVAPEPEM